MATITFKDQIARDAYMNEAEGIWEVARDDEQPEKATAIGIIEEACSSAGETYPSTVTIDDTLVGQARAILENLRDTWHEEVEGELPDDAVVIVGPRLTRGDAIAILCDAAEMFADNSQQGLGIDISPEMIENEEVWKTVLADLADDDDRDMANQARDIFAAIALLRSREEP